MNNKEVPHAWAHGRKGRAGNLTTDGTSLWSYAMLIGERRFIGDQLVYCCSAENRSVTTSAHQSLMRRAIPYGAIVVNSVAPTDRVLADLTDKALAATTMLASKRPGTQVWAYAQKSVSAAVEQIEQWCKLTGEEQPDLTAAAAAAAANAEEAKALRAANDARRAADQKDALARWLNWEPAGGQLPPGTWLRVRDGELHTSGGLKFPLQACKDRLAAGVAVGDDVFGFRCLEVSKARYVVGCHVMDRKHVESILC